MTVHEQLCFITTRIESYNKDDIQTTVGTGFFFSFEKMGKTHMLLITNKHVIGNHDTICIHLSGASNGVPLYNNHYNLEINGDISAIKYLHPNKDVDLCAIDITKQLFDLSKMGKSYFIRSFQPQNIPTKDDIDDIDPITSVEMIGYPDSLWDEYNNMPLFRKCHTATRIDLDWNGKKEFLIDGACYNGSSGSPIVLLEEGMYYSRKENAHKLGSTRMFLLGIQFATHLRQISGVLEAQVDNKNKQIIQNLISRSSVPNNLGYVIKAERIKEILDIIP